MSYKAQVYRVMIASPSDVPRERLIVRDTIHEWNAIHSVKESLVFMPVGWESHASPSMGDRPQGIISKQVLAGCDLLIAAFWTKLGTPTGVAPSGTVEEIQEHIAAGKPAMIYFSSEPVRMESVDREQYETMVKFKDECRQKGLIGTYESIAEFKEKLTRELALTINRNFTNKGDVVVEAPPVVPPIPSLPDAARQLLAEAAQDESGIIMRIRTTEGLTIQANRKNMLDNQDARTAAKWESALRELETHGLIQDRGFKGEVFGVTDEGYRVADVLRGQ